MSRNGVANSHDCSPSRSIMYDVDNPYFGGSSPPAEGPTAVSTACSLVLSLRRWHRFRDEMRGIACTGLKHLVSSPMLGRDRLDGFRAASYATQQRPVRALLLITCGNGPASFTTSSVSQGHDEEEMA
eukprot:scaffold100674_cov46-Prasinocladus_malaysianus.AAC.2